MSTTIYKLNRDSKLTKEQLKELEIMGKSPIVSDPEFPDLKKVDLSKAVSIGELRKNRKPERKRVEAITAERESGTGE